MVIAIRLIYNDLSDCFLRLVHLYLLLVCVFESAVLAVTHHHDEVGIERVVNDPDDVIVVVELLCRWVFVVLHSFNQIGFDMWSQFRIENF